MTSQGHPRSNVKVAIESPYMVSYLTYIESNIVAVTVLEIFDAASLSHYGGSFPALTPPRWGIATLLTQCSLCRPKSLCQTASRSVQPFGHDPCVLQTDRQTEGQGDRPWHRPNGTMYRSAKNSMYDCITAHTHIVFKYAEIPASVKL